MTKNHTIQAQVSLLVDQAYAQGLEHGRGEGAINGYYQALDDIMDALAKLSENRGGAPHRKPTTDPHSPRHREEAVKRTTRRRTLTNKQREMLTFIEANPGSTSNDILKHFKSVAPAYDLAKRRKVRREVDPKPWASNVSRVRFYPIDKETTE